jgi:hypothetical protein
MSVTVFMSASGTPRSTDRRPGGATGALDSSPDTPGRRARPVDHPRRPRGPQRRSGGATHRGGVGCALPARFPSASTGCRRGSRGVKAGVMRHLLEARAQDLAARGTVDLPAGVIDGTFVVANTGAPPWARPRGARGRRAWVWQTLLLFHSPGTRRLLAPMWSPVST